MRRKYKLGDRFSHDFDYDGMVEMALQTNSSWSISDLQKLYDSMEDVNYHTANKYLGSAIFALENDLPDVADIKLKKLHNELEEDDYPETSVTEPVFKGEEKKIFEFGKNIKNISQLKELTKFTKIDTSDNFTSVIQFLEINGYNKKLIDLLYKWQESQKTDASGWFEISKNFYEKYRADGKRYNDGGEINIDAELEYFDVDNLDDFETMQFNHHFPILGKVGALQVLINSVEGDYSQLSPELSELAEKQNPNFEMADGEKKLEGRYDTLAFITKKEAEKNKQEIENYYGSQLARKSEIIEGTDERGNYGYQVVYYLKYETSGMMADGGETLKNYQVIGTVTYEVGGPIPPEADREDYIDIETVKFSISVMASSEAEAERIAEEEIMDKYLLDDYGTWFTRTKQYYSGSVEIEDVIETGRYAKGGKINKRKKYTYIPKDEIESITTWNGKNITQEKILDGAYVRGNVKYAEGGETDSLKIKIEEDGDNYEVNYQFDDYEISGVLQKYYTGRANEYEFQPSWFADEESEKYYDENWEDIEDEILGVFYSKFKKGGQVKRNKYGEGGSVEQGNLEMMKNQAIQVKHHADELVEILKSSPRIDAWVLSLMDRATQNLSNITHYLDGELKHFAKGGMVNDESIIARYSYKERNVEGIYFFENGKLYEILSIAKPSYDKENASWVYIEEILDSKQDAMRWLEKNSRAEGYYDNLEFM